ncbi:hypothetical protein TNCT_458981 [Trichonephila clavata]|uniref:C2H2-type domain-containing protein n=1 Tax=Trichonephila clavata TaxID=2740835 RepID=A0A8X6LK96_TRICU|nr:hypothetical protein TNCT_458981 [Trichonephila clavata]
MPKHRSGFSTSTPRRHSRGSPVAHRTRRQISFARAVQIGLCKICHRMFPDTETLWAHINESHSPSSKQRFARAAFPIEFHINMDLQNFWLPATVCPKKGGPSSHCAETVVSGPSEQDQLADSLEKGLQLERSQSPVEVSCVQESAVAPELALPSIEVKPKAPGLSSSWCAPVRVFTGLDAQQAVSPHSKSLPLLTIDVQHGAPIWPPPFLTDPTCGDSPELDQVKSLPILTTVCEIPKKTRSPPRSQSPNVLDIVLGGDISLPDSPDLTALRKQWEGKVTGSPPSPGFPKPSFAQVAAKGIRLGIPKSVLHECHGCKRKFYTENGLLAHLCNKPQKPALVVTKVDSKGVVCRLCKLTIAPPMSITRHLKEAHPIAKSLLKNKTQSTPNAAPVISARCQFCERKFKSANALDNHMQRVHHIQRQNKPLRSVSSPPKNGRWCPACVGYVFDDLSKAAHDGLHHPKVTTAPPQQSTLPHQCPECSFRGVSKKAVFYHRRQAHPKAGPSTRVPEPPHSQIESVGDSPPQPTPTDIPQPQTQGGLSIVGSDLTVKFPIDPLFTCPIKGCRFQSKTKTWYATNHSLKRHLLITHKKRDLSVHFLCSLCNEPINRKPSSHSCLKASGLILKQSNPLTAWDCQECGETFPTKVGLDNHCLAHKKDAIKIKDVPVVVPPPTKAKRVARKERIRKHAVGPPALAPLSGPPPNTATDSPPPPGDIPLPLIDIQENRLLSSFVEPLNALLTHDDLPGAVDDFFGITQDLVAVVQQHFRIKTNLNNREGIPLAGKSWTCSTPRRSKGVMGGIVGNSSAS